MEKFWCCLGMKRRLVGKVECMECDKNAGLPIGSYVDCDVRKPYELPLKEAFKEALWWLKLLWSDPKDFQYLFSAHLLRFFGKSAGVLYERSADGEHRKLLL